MTTFLPFFPPRGRGRGGAAGRGGRGWHRGPPGSLATDNLPVPHASQKLLNPISSSQFEGGVSHTQAYKIKEVQYVASYNWIDQNTSTILVPGSPPKWLPPADKQQLREDDPNGQYYRDRNAANHPRFPIEPAVRAIYELKPYFETSQIDLFGCGSTIGSLLHFVNDEERTFRFGVERIGGTVFLVRKTNTPLEMISNVRGYGHSFPEAYTTWDPEVKGSSSYQRIIRYDFAGLQCMIRTESDGYLPDKLATLDRVCAQQVEREPKTGSKSTDHRDADTGVSLEDRFSSFAQAQAPGDATKKLCIQKAGKPIGQQAVFDLKTRSSKRRDIIGVSEFLPRLWANQTPNFVLAWHSFGLFDEINIKDVRDDINKWEQDNETTLARFYAVLRVLIKLSGEHTCFEVRRTARGALELWSEVEGWSALPPKLKSRWRNGNTDVESEEEEEKPEIKSEDNDEDADYLKF